MIPIRDENPTSTVPYVVYMIMALNILIYMFNGPFVEHGRNPLMGYLMVPKAVTTGINTIIPNAAAPWVTLFSHMFLHANLMHIGSNMLYLWIFGNNIEDAIGHFKFFLVYIACGLCAAAAQIIPAPMSQIPMMGASGAIAGILGAYILLYPKARIVSLVFLYQVAVLPASLYLGIWFVFQAFNSMLMVGMGDLSKGGVAFLAHIGGFIAGVVIILLMGGKKLVKGDSRYGYTYNNN
ncbi:MAG: rhomboid family intramembrane serine protease [Armatimonadota bacterium]